MLTALQAIAGEHMGHVHNQVQQICPSRGLPNAVFLFAQGCICVTLAGVLLQ